MPDATPPPPAGASPGLSSVALTALATAVDYFSLKVELLQVEARDAGRSIRRALACVVIGAFFLVLGYLVAVAAAVGLLQRYADWPWPLTLAGFALGHLLVGAILLFAASRTQGKGWFSTSLEELERDRAWLASHRQRPQGTPPHGAGLS